MRLRNAAAVVAAGVIVCAVMFFPLLLLGIPAVASGSCSLLGAVLTGQAMGAWLKDRQDR